MQPENRTVAGRFKPGSSGNPGGRPRALRLVEALARDHAPFAIETLARLMREGDAGVALRAAVAILDRAYGRPPVGVLPGDDEPDAPMLNLERLTDEELREWIRIVDKVKVMGAGQP